MNKQDILVHNRTPALLAAVEQELTMLGELP